MSYSGALVAGDPGAHRRVRFRGSKGGGSHPRQPLCTHKG